jgi:hypothetical protein
MKDFVEHNISGAQEAGSARVREAQERLAQENSTLRAQLMEIEAALLGEQEAVADMKLALAAAERRQTTPLKAVQVRCAPRCMEMCGQELGWIVDRYWLCGDYMQLKEERCCVGWEHLLAFRKLHACRCRQTG